MPWAARTRSFGRYVLLQRLGRGGMAEVWRARCEPERGVERTAVVKRLLPSVADDPAFVRMFIEEWRLCARLSHPNIVRLFEFGEYDNEYFLAMEHVHGRDLGAVHKKLAAHGRRHEVADAVFIARELCRALAYAHALCDDDGKPLGIIHRDVTPSNVMLSVDGAVKLVDFGIAKALAAATERTATGCVKGKMSYLAPEQLEARRDIDHRADQFSVGVVLHEMLTGRRLFRRDSDAQTIQAVLGCEVSPPSRENPAVTARLDEICRVALSRDPNGRYRDCGVMADALDAALGELGREPAITSLLAELFGDEPELDATGGDGGAITAATAATTARAPQRRRFVHIVLAALVLAGGAAIASSSFLTPRKPMTPVWTRLRGASATVSFEAVAVDALGDVYVGGSTTSAIDGQPWGGSADLVIMKYDRDGNWLWTRTRGDAGAQTVASLAVDPQGNVYATGNTNSGFDGQALAGGLDLFVTKFDRDGRWLWTRLRGGAGDENGTAIGWTTSGTVVTIGSYDGPGFDNLPASRSWDCVVVEWNGGGIWVNSTSWGTDDLESCYGGAVDPNGSVVGVGYQQPAKSNRSATALVVKWDVMRNISWVRRHGGPNVVASGVAIDGDHNLYVTGMTVTGFDGQPFGGGSSDIFLTKLSGDGNWQWTRLRGGAGDDGYFPLMPGCALVGDDVLVSAFTTQPFDGQPLRSGQRAFALVRYDRAGNWRGTVLHAGGGSATTHHAVAVEDDRTFYLAGFADAPLDNQPFTGALDGTVMKWTVRR
jgi:hypothetical protein